MEPITDTLQVCNNFRIDREKEQFFVVWFDEKDKIQVYITENRALANEWFQEKYQKTEDCRIMTGDEFLKLVNTGLDMLID